uniref:NAD-dependent epimerase/dehydratase family protein n=1 Tax=Agathobacter sp. TaxID=2021311 RepID=UPI004055DBCF
MRKVIVTGPTGAIGVALCNILAEKNMEVVAVCHRKSKRIKHIPKHANIKIVELDLSELSFLSDMLKDSYDVFYHLGWDGTFGNNRNNMEVQLKNIQYTLDAAEAAYQLGCKVFIGAGSQAEYGRFEGKLHAGVPTFPENGYGMAKLCAGQMSRIRCEQLGMKHIWTRILSVYGPYDGENTMVMSMIQSLLKGENPHCTSGEQMWDYIYSKDVAKILLELALKGKDGKTYCIGSGHATPLIQYMQMIRNRVNPNVQLGIGDIPYGEKQVMYLCADITELEEDIGAVPETKFEDGINDTVKWVQSLI